MTDQMRTFDIETTEEFRQVIGIGKRGVIIRNGAISIRVVVTPAIDDDPVLLCEPVELRQPLTVVLQSSVNEDNRITDAFFDVMEFDVTAVNLGNVHRRRNEFQNAKITLSLWGFAQRVRIF